MISNRLYSRLTCFTVCFTFLTLFTSKAGVNIAFALILLTAIAGGVGRQPILSKNSMLRRISYMSFALYALGLTVTFVTPFGFMDLSWFARKGAFFLLIPLLFPMLETHHQEAMKALLLGALVAMAYALYLYLTNQETISGRINSFWDIGRWGEILTYLWAILLPSIYFSDLEHKKRRIVLATIAVFTLIALLATGSRGPVLFATCSTLLFLLFTNRKLFCGVVVLGIISVLLMKDSIYFHSAYEKIASITASNNDSNNARFAMWHYGLGMTGKHLETNILLFLFGTGDTELPTIFTHYLNSIVSLEAIQQSVGNQMSYSDLHSLYIDNLVRMGLVFSLSYLAFISFLLYQAIKLAKRGSRIAWGMINLITTYLGIGLVYSNNLEFQTAIFFFILALCWVKCVQNKEHKEASYDS
ncbi:O-antigen ligase family protein [Vibrio barjaei]|uniref:O-antigen ligase family protein n=1 Tax=Vibrio barjaei TaxID=1676683 RepID=UPI0007BB143B|nr:O-antigen ligase family protein [Vibrio barjaei]OIN25477.1 hypothetical protein AWH66_2016770 [Vibrio barjaei]